MEENNIEYFKNKIVLGDCYELIKKIPDNSIDLIYTDIPYDTSYSGTGVLSKKLESIRININKNKENLLKRYRL